MGKKRRRAATARAAAAASARKVGMIPGCGAVCSIAEAEQRGDVTGVTEARKRRASSVRGVSRRRAHKGARSADARRRRGRQRRRRRGRPARSRAAARCVSIAEAEQRGDVTGVAEARRRHASSARGVSRRRARKGARSADAALSNGRGQIAGSPTVKEVERLELSYHPRFGVIVSNAVTTRLLRRVCL